MRGTADTNTEERPEKNLDPRTAAMSPALARRARRVTGQGTKTLMAKTTFKVTGRSESPARIAVQARQFKLVVDEPPSLGGDDHGANPVEYVLAGLAGCLNVMAHLIASEMCVTLRRLEIEASGELDTDRLLGKSGSVRAGFQRIKVALKVDTDADAVTLDRWLAAVKDRCPVSDNLANATPVQISLEKQP